MSKEKLRVRNIEPLESFPAILTGFRLSFQLRGFPFLEPGFATVEECEESEVHGVCHLMSHHDFYKKLLPSESNAGVIPDGYHPLEVKVTSYEGQTVSAFVLHGRGNAVEREYTLRPTKRYLNLLSHGKEYGINDDYSNWITEKHPAFERNLFGACYAVLILLLLLTLNSPVIFLLYLLKVVGFVYPITWYMNFVSKNMFWPLTAYCCNSGVTLDERPRGFIKGSTSKIY